jgi:hypothetical protein
VQNLWKTDSTSKKNTPHVEFGVGPLPSAKHKWHIDNTLDAKIAAGVVHKSERGFRIHIYGPIAIRLDKVIGVLPISAVYVAAYPDEIPRAAGGRRVEGQEQFGRCTAEQSSYYLPYL